MYFQAVAFMNAPCSAYQVHSRFVLLDTKTGYRSQYLAVSGVVAL